MNITEFVVGQVALLGWREGRRLSPGCRPAMLGICQVIRNRVESGWQNGDWLKIVNEIPVHGSEEIVNMDWRTLPDIYDKDYLWLHGQVMKVYDRSLPDDITSSADVNWASHSSGPRPLRRKGLFYCNLQLSNLRPWFVENIIRRPDEHPRQAEAGTVTFYA